MKKGDFVTLHTPDNPRLNGAKAKIRKITEWGAFVKTKASGTGRFRALFSEMIPVTEGKKGKEKGLAKEQGFTGDICSECGGCKMIRNGACLLCRDCGSSSGCS